MVCTSLLNDVSLLYVFNQYSMLRLVHNFSNRYDSEGKDTSLAPVGAEMGATRAGGLKSMYSDRVFLSHITSDPAMGQERV
jgi:replication factor A1